MSAEEKTSSSNKLQPSIRTEDILLERLKNEPKIAQQIGKPLLAIILIVIFSVGVAIFFFTRQPEKFAEDPHAKSQANDPAAISSKRLKFQPLIDSLKAVIVVDPNNEQARLTLANVYYECEQWDKAKAEYEFFLSKDPEDVDARVDYAFVLSQTSGDFKASLAEINKALKYDPDHVNALFNAGIMTIQANLDNVNNKKKAVRDAISYFSRALTAAEKQHNNKMVEQIQKVMDELRKLDSEGK